MEKRVIFATVLSTIVLMIWWFLMVPQQQPVSVGAGNAKTATIIQEPVASTQINGSIKPGILAGKSGITSKIKEYSIENKNCKIVFNTQGAKISSWYIKEKNSNQYIDLAADKANNNLSTFADTNYELVSKTENTGYDIITFKTVVNKQVQVYKSFEINKITSFHKLKIKVINNSGQQIPVNLLWGPGFGTDTKLNATVRVYSIFKNEKNKFRLSVYKPGSHVIDKQMNIGIDNRYFGLVLMDLSGKFDSITVSKNKKVEGSYEFSLNTKSDPGTVKDINMEFYCGNKLYNQIKKLGFGLETTVDFGAFKELSKFFLYLLNFFHKISNNYGIAIILLSILLQIVTYPLTLKSFQSARAMKHLQPKIQELQLKYKSDPKRMQAETMHLYKTQKVNPFGGCLPMVLQIPIFWALFSALQSAYELRHANFVFWINDLSNSDPLLPILMGVSMFIQQKMTAVSGDQTQKMMLYMMPVMFTVIFWNFPSGLVLYWLTNNILSIIIQYIVLKRDTVTVS